MSTLQEPPEVKLFIGLIFQPDSAINELFEMLENEMGPVDFRSNITTFSHSSYYKKEMGDQLVRQIIAFEKLIRRADIIKVKAFTNKLEEVFSYEGDRTINIDPGYIAQEHVILATGKGYSHRPYLGKGVYADLTLIFINDEYTTLKWTYPDYGTEEMRRLFKNLRNQYVSQLKEETAI